MARIVVVGSAAQDDVVWLHQPLSEGHHLDACRRKLRLGGGGANTAIPLCHAGHQVQLVAAVGADPVGDWLLGMLEAAGVDTTLVMRVPGESTRSLVLLDPAGERTIINLHRCGAPRVPERVRSLAADAVYVRCRELDLADALAERTADSLVVAHVPPLAERSRPAAVLVGSAADLPPAFLADPWVAGRAIAGEALRWVVVTHGAEGALAVRPGERLHVPAPEVDVVDTTGAGDVFAAGLVHGLVEGRPMAEALRTAVAWGAAAVRCAELPEEDAIRTLA
jgi:sugar/nucleoside kinase (ribokinase family)